jgi:hypothetical protein
MNAPIHDVQFDAATEKVIDKVRKLLALASGNTNEQEAEAAANKARELLEAYNLDVAIVNRNSNKFAPRDKKNMPGGLYTWQRTLWNEVAGLNFCKYWFIRGLHAGSQYQHELLGSKANVIATQVMANYLQETIERLARQWVHHHRPGKSIFIKEAIAYREGIASRLSTRLWNLRQERIQADEERVKAEREEKAAAGIFTENAMVIVDVINSEEDLNNDYINGWEPGTSARHRVELEARRRAAEIAADKALKAQEEWDAAHPEEAAARKIKEREEYEALMKKWSKEAKNRRPRKMTPEEERRHLSSYREGYHKGDSISLNKQVDNKPTKRLT